MARNLIRLYARKEMKKEDLVVPQDVCCVVQHHLGSLRCASFGKGAMLAPVASPMREAVT